LASGGYGGRDGESSLGKGEGKRRGSIFDAKSESCALRIA
jgi:hypothetical protein